MQHHLILRVVTRFVLPFILLFALYVQFHGDFGPGGGFQAGVIFAAGMILYTLVFGLDNATRVVPPSALRVLMASGVLLYLAVGFATVLLGGNFLSYDTLAENAKDGQHYGILLVELGVGITVTSTMIAIFYVFVGRNLPSDDTRAGS